MKPFFLLCLCLFSGFQNGWAQQRDSMATCGFSRIKFPIVSPPRNWFHPAQAIVTMPATFRSGPVSIASPQGRIDTPATLYLLSDDPLDGYFQVLNFRTGRPCWISAEAILAESEIPLDSTTASPNFDGSLRLTGALSKGAGNAKTNAALRVVNHNPFALTLMLAGKAYTVPAAQGKQKGTKNIVLKAGAQGYVISVPAAYPNVVFGWGNFLAGKQYQYRVEIESIE